MGRDSEPAFYEFFAGGGLARLGLAPDFACVFANDFDRAKAKAYSAAFGAAELKAGDVWALEPRDLPGQAALAWASFPCQDLSLAGARGGLDAPRSGAFWGFWRLIEALDSEGRAPPLLALENVSGLLSSRGGADFTALIAALAARGYWVGALEIDAAWFTPQSRPRLFIVASRHAPPRAQIAPAPVQPFHGAGLIGAVDKLAPEARARWVWWRLPAPPLRNTRLADIIEPEAPFDPIDRTQKLIAMMSPLQRARLAAIQASGRREIGALFKRIRVENGARVQRAEARFDGVAGCLRTPAGGSSRQTLLFVEGDDVRSRLLTAREAARLMGAPDSYPLPPGTSAALHVFGDAVCASAVRWLSAHLLAPLAAGAAARAA